MKDVHAPFVAGPSFVVERERRGPYSALSATCHATEGEMARSDAATFPRLLFLSLCLGWIRVQVRRRVCCSCVCVCVCAMNFFKVAFFSLSSISQSSP